MEPTSATLASALAFRRAGDLGQAEEVYNQILQADPLQVEALQGLAGIAYQLGRYDQAAEWLRRAAALREGDPILHSNLGAAYRAAGRLAEAEACYQEALRLRPDLAETYNNLANILKSQGRRAEALAYYWQAVLARPNYAAAHHNLGLALLEQGDLDEAAARLREAVRLQPDWLEARQGLSFALTGASVQPPPAPAVAEENPQARAEAEAHFTRGVALGREGRLKEAAAAFQHALRLKPDHAEACLKLGAVLREQGHG
jgi:Flp pilus assembly protein TadD